VVVEKDMDVKWSWFLNKTVSSFFILEERIKQENKKKICGRIK